VSSVAGYAAPSRTLWYGEYSAVEDVQGALLRPVRREGDGDQPAVGRGREPVDRGRAALVDRVRVDHDAGLGRVVQIGQRHEERLLPRRLALQHEVRRPGSLWALEAHSVAGAAPRNRLRLYELLGAPPHRVVGRQVLEERAGPLVLGGRPRPRLLGPCILQPAVVLGDRHAVVGRADRDPRRCGRLGGRHPAPFMSAAPRPPFRPNHVRSNSRRVSGPAAMSRPVPSA